MDVISGIEARAAVCIILRKIGRADAAQRLENRTEEEWQRMSWSKHHEDGLYLLGVPESYIGQSFLWPVSKEGEPYWRDVYSQVRNARLARN
jgi:hypothetical protein